MIKDFFRTGQILLQDFFRTICSLIQCWILDKNESASGWLISYLAYADPHNFLLVSYVPFQQHSMSQLLYKVFINQKFRKCYYIKIARATGEQIIVVVFSRFPQHSSTRSGGLKKPECIPHPSFLSLMVKISMVAGGLFITFF